MLLEILAARLADIREWWDAGVLSERGLTAPEVCHLITALFENTQTRKQVLEHVGGRR